MKNITRGQYKYNHLIDLLLLFFSALDSYIVVYHVGKLDISRSLYVYCNFSQTLNCKSQCTQNRKNCNNNVSKAKFTLRLFALLTKIDLLYYLKSFLKHFFFSSHRLFQNHLLKIAHLKKDFLEHCAHTRFSPHKDMDLHSIKHRLTLKTKTFIISLIVETVCVIIIIIYFSSFCSTIVSLSVKHHNKLCLQKNQ